MTQKKQWQKRKRLEVSFFFYQGFLHRQWQFTWQQGKEGDHLLLHSTTSTHSRSLRHLFATLHVRWLSRIFNRNANVYQTTARWDLPPYRILSWVVDWWCNVCLFTWLIGTRFLLEVSLFTHERKNFFYQNYMTNI